MKHFTKGTSIVLDDEKYFTFAHHDLSGNDIFYTKDIERTPDNVRYNGKAKYEQKILVWIAISSKGVSAPFIRPIGGPAINADVYISECIPKLKEFVDKYHKNDKIIFWPDLASSHYSNKSLQCLTDQKVPFVPKEDNPPNVPQARPVENFWGVLDRMVYDNGWEAKTELHLVNRIAQKLKEIDITVVQAMMKTIKKTLRKIEDNGPLKTI